MVYVIHGRKMKQHTWYRGVIKRYKGTPVKLIIVVEFEEDPGVEYLKSIKVNESTNSPFARVVEDLCIVDEYGRVELEELEDMHVKATLRKDREDNLWIHRICIDDDYYDSMESADEEEYEDEYDDEEYDDDEEDNDE